MTIPMDENEGIGGDYLKGGVGFEIHGVWRLDLRRCTGACGAATGPGLPRWQDVRRLREGRCTVGCGAQLSGATPKGQQSEIFS